MFDSNFPGSGGFLPQHLYTSTAGFMLNRYNFLIELTEKTVQQLVTGGILQHDYEIGDFYAGMKFYSAAMEDGLLLQKSTILTLDDLSYGFVLWMFACMISCVTFLSELALFYFKFSAFSYCFSLLAEFIFWIFGKCLQILQRIFLIFKLCLVKIWVGWF